MYIINFKRVKKLNTRHEIWYHCTFKFKTLTFWFSEFIIKISNEKVYRNIKFWSHVEELSLCHKLWFAKHFQTMDFMDQIIQVWNIKGLHLQGTKIYGLEHLSLLQGLNSLKELIYAYVLLNKLEDILAFILHWTRGELSYIWYFQFLITPASSTFVNIRQCSFIRKIL